MSTTQRIAVHATILSVIGTGVLVYGTWDLLPWWSYPIAFFIAWSYLYNGWVKDSARENMANMMDR
ncbi:MAG: hypothetical protein ACYCZT_10440 [Thiobacillus sp.]